MPFLRTEIKMKRLISYFTKFEITLWSASVILTVFSFLVFDGNGYLTLIASIIGVTSLILCAKGNPIGQALMVVFSILYGIISYSFAYYGEMITYLGMSGPMALFSLISWMKNPYNGKKSEVKVNKVSGNEVAFMLVLSVAVTVMFYFILKHFGTSSLLASTVSVTTSFIAVYLTFRRSPYYALVYACNDIVLIVLWSIAAFTDTSYLSVIICFVIFLVNDLYGFFSWKKMSKRQKNCG